MKKLTFFLFIIGIFFCSMGEPTSDWGYMHSMNLYYPLILLMVTSFITQLGIRKHLKIAPITLYDLKTGMEIMFQV